MIEQETEMSLEGGGGLVGFGLVFQKRRRKKIESLLLSAHSYLKT